MDTTLRSCLLPALLTSLLAPVGLARTQDVGTAGWCESVEAVGGAQGHSWRAQAPTTLYLPADHGAVGDGETDDTRALQRTIDAAIANGGDVCLSRTTYMVSAPLEIHLSYGQAFSLIGDWATIRAGGDETFESVLSVSTAAPVTIRQLRLDASSLADHALVGFKITGAASIVEQVGVANARSHGIVLRACQVANFRNVSSTANGGDGWLLEGNNGSLFEHVSATGNDGNRFTVAGLTWGTELYSGGCTLQSVHAEKNLGHGLEMVSAVGVSDDSVVLRGGWFESNAGDGVRVGLPNSAVEDLRIVSAGVPGTASIRLLEHTYACVVTGNRSANAGVTSYHRVHVVGVPGDEALHHIEGNYSLYSGAESTPYIVAP